MVTTQIFRGLDTDNETAVMQGYNASWSTLYISQRDNATDPTSLGDNGNPSDGIQYDWSFHQHGPMMESGSYGQVYALAVLSMLNQTFGLVYQAPPEQLEIFAALVLDGMQWMTIEQVWDWSVIGRSNTSPLAYGYGISLSGQQLQYIPYRNDEFQRFAGQILNEDVAPLEGNRHYYCSDYMVHRRADWFTTVKMYSTRILGSECVNEQGKESEHISDAVNYLYYTGQEYKYIFGVWDWQQLPGITCEQNPELLLPCAEPFILNASFFVGGVSTTMYGACGMQLRSHNLTAAKGYLFFDTAYVAVSTNITCRSTNDVYTTINNVPYRAM